MMGRRIRNLALGAALALALPAAAVAQTTIYGGAGLLTDTGDVGDVTDAGFLALAGVVFGVGEGGVGIGVEGLYGSLGGSDSGPDVDILGMLATIGIIFGEEGNVRPYLYGGAGIVNLEAGDSESPGADNSETQFGYEGVAGLDFPASESVGIFVEGRFLGSTDLTSIGAMAGVAVAIG